MFAGELCRGRAIGGLPSRVSLARRSLNNSSFHDSQLTTKRLTFLPLLFGIYSLARPLSVVG